MVCDWATLHERLGVPQNACRIAKVGVAFKRRLSFFEPVVSRTQWLMQNPTATVIILTRAMYRGWRSSGVEAWLVLKIGHETASGSSIFFAQTG